MLSLICPGTGDALARLLSWRPKYLRAYVDPGPSPRRRSRRRLRASPARPCVRRFAIADQLWAQATATGKSPLEANVVPLSSWGSEIDSLADVFAKALGLALTIGAVSFGSEFWMGILSRLTGRSDGKREPQAAPPTARSAADNR